MLFLKRTYYFFITELIKLRKAPLPFVLAFVMPIVVWTFLAIVFKNGEVRDVAVAVVDYDQSSVSRMITSQINSTEAAEVVYCGSDRAYADELMKQNQSFYTIVIEKGFSEKIKSNRSGNVNIVVNGFNMIYSKVLYKAIAQILLGISKDIQIKKLIDYGFSSKEANIRANPILTEIQALGNPYFNYTIYLLPGMLISLLQMSSSFSTIWVFREGKEHSAGRIMPMKGYKLAWLIGRLLPLFLLSVLATIILFTVIFPLAGIYAGSMYFSIFLLTVLLIIVSMGMGTLLSLLLSNLVSASQALLVINAASFVFSGYTFPRWAMPEAISKFAEIIPVTHYLEAFFPMFLFDYSPQRGLVELLIMGIILWGLVFILMSRIGTNIRNWFRKVLPGKEVYSVTK